ncbi:MAG TPA: glycoside hydrolase family 16 protein [Solirubrobacteraceae bacterium]|nr:glycoside hydrolase family 16 protein [Solirubrobacteraceae bacterium]
MSHRSPNLRMSLAAALAAILALALASVAFATSGAHDTTTTVHRSLHAPGRYTVLVQIAPPKADETVDVSVAGQSQDGVPLTAGGGQSLVFFVHARTRRLVVRAVASGGPAASLKVAVAPASAATGRPTVGPYHNLAWSDEFGGAAGTAPNPSDWSLDTPGSGCGAGTLSQATSSTANASLDGHGDLAITAAANPAGSPAYTSAQLDSSGHYALTYGTIEARIELPSGSGLCSAFWLLDDTPAGTSCPAGCPEIDVLEAVSPFANVGFGSLHGPVQISNDLQFQGTVTATKPLTGAFHTWGVIWQPGRITWTLDGLPYATITPATLPPTAQWVFDGAQMRIILDLAVGGFWALDPSSSAGFPASLKLAWVRVYK